MELRRKLVIGATGFAVLAGAGATFAATRGSDDGEREAFLADAAKRLHVSPDKLESALRGAFSDRLDAAVRHGRLTRKEADAIKRHAREHGGAPPFLGAAPFRDGPPPFLGGAPRFREPPPLGGARRPHGLRFLRPGPPLLRGLHTAARYLGLSDAGLRDGLASGRSLAQIARARGKSIEGLEDALKDDARRRLDRAVDRGRLTRSEERRILGDLDRHLGFLLRLGAPYPPAPPPLPR